MMSRFILIAAFLLSTAASAQYAPLQPTAVSYSVSKLELVDTTFIEKLNTFFFQEECGYIEGVGFGEFRKWRGFGISVDIYEDGVTYLLWIELIEYISSKSIGYVEYDGYSYAFSGIIIPDIYVKTNSKKKISYIQPAIPDIVDPPLWILEYNSQTKEIIPSGKWATPLPIKQKRPAD